MRPLQVTGEGMRGSCGYFSERVRPLDSLLNRTVVALVVVSVKLFNLHLSV